ncbi:MAG: DUF6350 family protein [Microcella sp.]|uniref:cell division protein PerM n=1 Tax=Microcella sp. TaxID=1913979 RepID=UPI002717D550|nr:DUF6350 family protein [Microcella sp.]MDO8337308.1 DUF6350 family protein [Microcella sp.]
MNRRSTVLFSALEALLVVGIGIGIPLSILTVMWAVQFGFQLDWLPFWRAAVDIWALGHGADVTFTLDPVTAAAVGAEAAAEPFLVSLALLGFAALTLLAGWQMGRRSLGERHRALGGAVAIAGILVIGGLAALSATHPAALIARGQTALFPALVFALGFGVASLDARGPWRERADALLERLPALARGIISSALRIGTGAVITVVGAAGVVTAAALLVGYGQVIALYESVQADVLGGIALTVGQLALIPTVVLWSASWLIGPGFAIGTGSAISPLGTVVGPLPAIPLLGALPASDASPGLVVVLVPVLAAFVAGVLVRPRLVAALDPGRRVEGWALATAGAAALAAGILAAFSSWIAAGAAGPGRLATIGPDPVAVGVWMLVETLVGAALGLLAGGVRVPWSARASDAHPRSE